MHRRHHIIWYRPGDSKPREAFLSPTVLRILLGFALLVFVVLVLETIFYSDLLQRAYERDQLVNENEELRREVARVDMIEQQLSELQQFSSQVKRSLTEGADLERILRAGEEVEEELPVGSQDAAWVPIDPASSDQVNRSLERVPAGGSAIQLSLPSRWPVEGFITRGFEGTSVDPALSHAGIDIAVPRGTPIRAVGSGIVLVADWTPRYGYRVVIDHGSAVLSMYGHNELLLVQPGDRVRAGSPIALSGNSGISTAPHLHLEIWISGRAVNPMALLPNRGDEDGSEQTG
jgi:murein DD-endopeptidase MepM/ murein hydrolase activator NlpD